MDECIISDAFLYISVANALSNVVFLGHVTPRQAYQKVLSVLAPVSAVRRHHSGIKRGLGGPHKKMNLI